jgi:hypothetical protein
MWAILYAQERIMAGVFYVDGLQTTVNLRYWNELFYK